MFYIYTAKEISNLVSRRDGEIKLGEMVSVIQNRENYTDEIKNSDVKFVVFGIPEDIGIKLNRGKGGAYSAFIPALKSLLNIQENQYITGKNILILGYIDVIDTVEEFDREDVDEGDRFVKKLDREVSNIVEIIINSGKIPIIIGGGHNNAYGNLKGLSLANKSSINVVNLDAHTDLRQLEERHSGNGFSYAQHEGYLDKYFMFGIHENYTPQYIFEAIHKNPNFAYSTFEELAIYQSVEFDQQLKKALQFVNNKSFGVEIDLDSIQGFPSSAIAPTGFTPEQARRFTSFLAQDKNARYLHICEGAPVISSEKLARDQVGEFISFLASDFIKRKQKR